ncbi:hypothetical protein AB0C07_32470 [Actinoplanes missouriensis]|uniref:hypothetical protein n=1 Tax=Actinoplanes missouriensis TaxID=1866 RepID=UPI0033F314F4
MRLLTLYLRSRRVPAALLGTAGVMALMWVLSRALSESPAADVQLVMLTVLLLVVALTATLGGPDDALDSTAAFSWAPRRAVHLLAAVLVVAALMLATQLTGARFGPAGLVIRDAAGLLGLTALGAATAGVARSWFLPLGWTLGATLFPQGESLAGRVLTWQAQEPSSTAAAVTAGVFAVSGLIAYAMSGPANGAPAEATQQ